MDDYNRWSSGAERDERLINQVINAIRDRGNTLLSVSKGRYKRTCKFCPVGAPEMEGLLRIKAYQGNAYIKISGTFKLYPDEDYKEFLDSLSEETGWITSYKTAEASGVSESETDYIA